MASPAVTRADGSDPHAGANQRFRRAAAAVPDLAPPLRAFPPAAFAGAAFLAGGAFFAAGVFFALVDCFDFAAPEAPGLRAPLFAPTPSAFFAFDSTLFTMGMRSTC